MEEKQRRRAVEDFARRWRGRGYEKGESQSYWIELLRDVLGVERPTEIITFEERVRLDHTSFIDGYITPTKVLIEQKGLGKDLRKPIRQSDGSVLTPFQQAKRYSAELPYSERPRWIVTCNFASLLVYDMEQPGGEPYEIQLERLPEEYYRLRFLVDPADRHVSLEAQVSLQAGEIVARLYAALQGQYHEPDAVETLRSLNVLCVRLVFCLYAEDAGILGRHGMFHDYLARFAADPSQVRRALLDLFAVLDTPPSDRDPYMDERLAAFPYVNGGLFSASVPVTVPRFNAEIVELLLADASDDFDWSHISPTIFGSLFESTLNPATRRRGGMHYTSIANIHKVIDPLFLDRLRGELDEIGRLRTERTRRARIEAFRWHLAGLRFMDPACGSGNFLTETYLSLRRIENECLRLLRGDGGQISIGGEFSPIRVSISQFYGIEVNDFAVAVARTALWIAEVQMKQETESIVGRDLDYLPLRTYPNIIEANALRTDWAAVCPPSQMSYIMGNPPFTGARLMSAVQKEDLLAVFGKGWKGAGNLDYVCGWYKRAADYMRGTGVRAAFVSSNSVTQGEQVALLWKPLAAQGVTIDFAYRTFRWDSEARDKAHVHCVIVGFGPDAGDGPKLLFEGDGEEPAHVEHINAYLLPMRDVFIESRTRPLCDVPEIGIGNKPIDGGNYLFTAEERDEFLRSEPSAAQYFHPWYGSQEFINRRPRYCLWLGDCTPAQLRAMPHCLRRVEAVRNFRLASSSAGTRLLADRPTRFHVENMPKTNYLLIPRVSSERREYIPIGFMSPGNLSSDSVHIIPGAGLWHFGVLTSSVHMAWTRTVCGRLKSDYRYSKDIVYNNFPWPTDCGCELRGRIEEAARGVIEARALFPDSTLADLYDPVTMPPELRAAHRRVDRLVLSAYGLPPSAADAEVVSRLFTLHERLTAI